MDISHYLIYIRHNKCKLYRQLRFSILNGNIGLYNSARCHHGLVHWSVLTACMALVDTPYWPPGQHQTLILNQNCGDRNNTPVHPLQPSTTYTNVHALTILLRPFQPTCNDSSYMAVMVRSQNNSVYMCKVYAKHKLHVWRSSHFKCH